MEEPSTNYTTIFDVPLECRNSEYELLLSLNNTYKDENTSEYYLNSYPFVGCLPVCGLCTVTLDDNPENRDYLRFNLIVMGVVLPILGILGLVGNALSAFVYSRPESRCSANLYLCALACSDSTVILTSFLLYSIDIYRRFSATVHKLYGSFTPIMYPMSHVAQVSSVYFTVVAGIDCLVQTCFSNRARNSFCTTKTARCAIIAVVLLSIFYNLPHCFEAAVFSCFHEKFQKPSLELCPSTLRRQQMYVTIYYEWMYSIFVAVGPLLLLVFITIVIVYASVCGSKSGGLGEHISLILVVLLFIVCNTVALLINFIESGLQEIFINYLTDFANILVMFNSCFNFVIYVTFSTEFRRILNQYLLGKRERLRELPPSSSTANNHLINSTNGGIVAPAPPIVITEKTRKQLANSAYGDFLTAQKEVLI